MFLIIFLLLFWRDTTVIQAIAEKWTHDFPTLVTPTYAVMNTFTETVLSSFSLLIFRSQSPLSHIVIEAQAVADSLMAATVNTVALKLLELSPNRIKYWFLAFEAEFHLPVSSFTQEQNKNGYVVTTFKDLVMDRIIDIIRNPQLLALITRTSKIASFPYLAGLPCSSSQWASPLHIAPKPGGGWHPCGDFRCLNGHIKADYYPVPYIHDLFWSIFRQDNIFKDLPD